MGISGPIFLAKVLRSPTDVGRDIWTNIFSQSVKGPTNVGGDIWISISSQCVKFPHSCRLGYRPICLAKVLRSSPTPHTDVGGDIWISISSQSVKGPTDVGICWELDEN